MKKMILHIVSKYAFNCGLFYSVIGETPPYHYGTHYSSAMIVASYLVRMEPFTQHFLKLQVNSFSYNMYWSVKLKV